VKRSTLKKQITRQVSDHKGYDYKETWYCIWQNVLKEGGLRLTPQGFIIFGTELGIAFWKHELPKPTLQHLYQLDQKLQCPYYVIGKTLVVFDERTAVELSLYAGNIELFLSTS